MLLPSSQVRQLCNSGAKKTATVSGVQVHTEQSLGRPHVHGGPQQQSSDVPFATSRLPDALTIRLPLASTIRVPAAIAHIRSPLNFDSLALTRIQAGADDAANIRTLIRKQVSEICQPSALR